MHTLETDWWSLDLPDEWEAEQEEETIILCDEDGVGMIEITALERDESGVVDLQALAAQLFPDHPAATAAQLGDFTGLYFQYHDEGDAVREWLLSKGEQVVLISYSCDIENAAMDDEFVDGILDTLRAE
ncbi:MAG: hypothetical protein JWM78_1959 [Verrucomicrobiaceae bacterium]|nr:hypothetical protein [Verrucomicrobiaceae bacterium]